ncbi:endonuclease/exonuclease/phosphatase family protein [Thiomicrorhabdus arctica]|jgi:endonuclease/exonuclease/phosphatase family metal-dependent hydrolase|uniref:endonuclease/exonuclease/phosphatase family protein n=1 Tax=Thiomicrorhabdus arctica TaxID=131540 RepID=UPI00036C2AC0|nr:endonuclease/exonuclease/phosphatase family protein [Thiomicrorhabdus arctica]
MLRPKTTPLSQHAHPSLNSQKLPTHFTLITWNLQKIDFSHYINRPIEHLLNLPTLHILSLQEAATHHLQQTFFNLPFVMASNIQTRRKHYGVMTASDYAITPYQQCLTRSRELGLATHKTALITQHPLQNGQILTLVNIHAINFVPNYIFKKELQMLWSHLSQTPGPLIVSGDFNTWNEARKTILNTAAEELDLTLAPLANPQAIKTLNRQPLDHVFYRGLHLTDSYALSVPSISDHNPLITTFTSL